MSNKTKGLGSDATIVDVGMMVVFIIILTMFTIDATIKSTLVINGLAHYENVNGRSYFVYDR